DIGVQALGTNPFKTEKRGIGEVNVTLTMQNQIVQPKHYVYADWNGVLISKQKLDF
ncbi:putative 4-hydroxy-4-methyl-2-oxoglutarate aldolase, partial [Vibrio parahaemolyticus]|nr:putative 4-hydroxy-4-methyl-2-oxoglutarate aldolase [Vibrio parahaemolyticus]